MDIKKEYEKSVNANGNHTIEFYKHKGRFITLAEHAKLWENKNIRHELSVVKHWCHKYNIDMDKKISFIIMMTSKEKTFVPSCEGGKMLMIKNHNISNFDITNFIKFANPIIIVDNTVFPKFFRTYDDVSNMPDYVKSEYNERGIEYVTQKTLKATQISIKESLSNYQYAIRRAIHTICYNETNEKVFVADNCGEIDLTHKKIYENEISDLYQNFDRVIKVGFRAEYIEHCIEIITNNSDIC